MAERDRPDELGAEIEVTPEMVRAGASVLYGMELTFAGEEFWAKRVYLAMSRLKPLASPSLYLSSRESVLPCEVRKSESHG
jgi:hypothetical protein